MVFYFPLAPEMNQFEPSAEDSPPDKHLVQTGSCTFLRLDTFWAHSPTGDFGSTAGDTYVEFQ